MSFWSRAALTLAGAAAGYLAARRGPAVVRTGRELVLRGPSALSEQTPSPGGNAMARFWSSSAAAPLRAGALKAVRFAATVKQGMAEKESELNRRYAAQQRDLRPGSLDSWDRPLSAQPRIAPEDPAAAPPPQADAAETTTSPTEKDDR